VPAVTPGTVVSTCCEGGQGAWRARALTRVALDAVCARGCIVVCSRVRGCKEGRSREQLLLWRPPFAAAAAGMAAAVLQQKEAHTAQVVAVPAACNCHTHGAAACSSGPVMLMRQHTCQGQHTTIKPGEQRRVLWGQRWWRDALSRTAVQTERTSTHAPPLLWLLRPQAHLGHGSMSNRPWQGLAWNWGLGCVPARACHMGTYVGCCRVRVSDAASLKLNKVCGAPADC